MPNRILKDTIRESAQIDELTWFEEVVFYRLIVSADDYGCFDGRPVVIKNTLFPTKESVTRKAIEDAIQRLASVGLLQTYEVSGMPYLFLPTWGKHQRVRQSKHKYPSPPTCGNSPQIAANCGNLPPESESNPNPIQSESESESEARGCAWPSAAFAAVMAHYQDKIAAAPSQIVVAEMQEFCNQLPAELCIRAIDIALAERKTNWSYIRGILRRFLRDGITSLQELDERDARRQRQRSEPETTNPFLEIAREEAAKHDTN